MIRIAFCDDDITTLEEIRVLLDAYSAERDCQIIYTAYHSPLDLLSAVECGIRFDILLLDVLMPGENGIDTAAEIRNFDTDVKIVFLTSTAEYAVQSYAVRAYFYLLKPIQKESFFRVLDSALVQYEKERANSLLLRCKSGITRINPKQLEYCEVIHRTLLIHLVNGTVLESIGSLDELYRQLMNHGTFMRPHRSYLVNPEYVQNLSFRAITMVSQAEIPIPRGKYNEIKNEFLESAFQNRQVIL